MGQSCPQSMMIKDSLTGNTVCPPPNCPTGTLTISTSATTVCPGTAVTFVATASISSGTITGYSWYANGTLVQSGTSPKYIVTSLTSGESVYCIISVHLSGCTGVNITSNTINESIYTSLSTVTITPSAQTILCGGAPGTLTASTPSGGNGTYLYQWQTSTNNSTWTPIGSPTSSNTCNPPNITIGGPVYYNVIVSSCNYTTTSPSVTVTATLSGINGGTITPASQSINYGGTPAMLTCSPASGNCVASGYTYQWQSAPQVGSIHPFANIPGATGANYSPPPLGVTTAFMRVSTYSYWLSNGEVVQEYVGTGNSTTTTITVSDTLNYIQINNVTKPGVTDTTNVAGLTSPYDIQQTTQFFDGLGRPIQTVARQASPLQNDMVTMHVYDALGRESTQYMPYSSVTNNGFYKYNAQSEQSSFNAAQFPTDQYYYSQVNFEASPLNRVAAVLPPGNSWVGSSRGVSSQYMTNTIADSVQAWNIAFAAESLPLNIGLYGAGQLYKTVTINEQGQQEIEYKDKKGHAVLKRVQLATSPGTGHVGWLNTYYVYDDADNLRFVIQPRAVELLNNGSIWTINPTIANELCFRYEYDHRNRMIIMY